MTDFKSYTFNKYDKYVIMLSAIKLSSFFGAKQSGLLVASYFFWTCFFKFTVSTQYRYNDVVVVRVYQNNRDTHFFVFECGINLVIGVCSTCGL